MSFGGIMKVQLWNSIIPPTVTAGRLTCKTTNQAEMVAAKEVAENYGSFASPRV
jgi:hypothetical protein